MREGGKSEEGNLDVEVPWEDYCAVYWDSEQVFEGVVEGEVC